MFLYVGGTVKASIGSFARETELNWQISSAIELSFSTQNFEWLGRMNSRLAQPMGLPFFSFGSLVLRFLRFRAPSSHKWTKLGSCLPDLDMPSPSPQMGLEICFNFLESVTANLRTALIFCFHYTHFPIKLHNCVRRNHNFENMNTDTRRKAKNKPFKVYKKRLVFVA